MKIKCDSCGNPVERGRTNRKRHPECQKPRKQDPDRHYKYSYGMTKKEYDVFMADKVCGICGTDQHLVLDHDHETGRPRGVLCRRHNGVLGELGDTPEGVWKALEYLIGDKPDWDTYFAWIAKAVALRADCSRRKVGSVVVRDNRIVSSGYNGSPPGGPSCLAGGCPRADSGVDHGSSYDTGAGHCIAAHSESNSIIYAGRDGCLDSTLYLTCDPCEGCGRLVEAAGIARVVVGTT